MMAQAVDATRHDVVMKEILPVKDGMFIVIIIQIYYIWASSRNSLVDAVRIGESQGEWRSWWKAMYMSFFQGEPAWLRFL